MYTSSSITPPLVHLLLVAAFAVLGAVSGTAQTDVQPIRKLAQPTPAMAEQQEAYRQKQTQIQAQEATAIRSQKEAAAIAADALEKANAPLDKPVSDGAWRKIEADISAAVKNTLLAVPVVAAEAESMRPTLSVEKAIADIKESEKQMLATTDAGLQAKLAARIARLKAVVAEQQSANSTIFKN